MIGNCSVGAAEGTSVVSALTFWMPVSSVMLKRACLLLLPHLIKFFSFIFHSSAVSSSRSALAPLYAV